MLTRVACLGGLLILMIALPGCPPQPTDQDEAFMFAAAQNNIAEIQLGNLALQKAVNAGVKAYGQQMINDHTLANEQLSDLAASKDFTLPTTPNLQQLLIAAQLSALEGNAFDVAYTEANIIAHEQAIALFQTEVAEGDDPDVVAYAQQNLPILQAHLDEAQALLLLLNTNGTDGTDGTGGPDGTDDTGG